MFEGRSIPPRAIATCVARLRREGHNAQTITEGASKLALCAIDFAYGHADKYAAGNTINPDNGTRAPNALPQTDSTIKRW